MAELIGTEADPFSAVAYSTGVTLDLTAPEPELATQMVGLLWREGRMADAGVRCGYKDDGQDCLTCPHATLDPAERRSRLCRLGKDQRSVEQQLTALHDERLAPVMEMAAAIDDATEMGHLPDDLAELLTSVGL